MSAAEADRYAQGIWQLLDFTLIVFFVIQHQKYPVISIRLTVFQLFFGYANTHFSKEGQRIRLVFFQTARIAYSRSRCEWIFRLSRIQTIRQALVCCMRISSSFDEAASWI